MPRELGVGLPCSGAMLPGMDAGSRTRVFNLEASNPRPEST